MRNQTHALYIEYFNLEASPVNKMPSCVLPKNIIVDVKKLKNSVIHILRHNMDINKNSLT
jgi:hypothetical protein